MAGAFFDERRLVGLAALDADRAARFEAAIEIGKARGNS